jgi:hypothetical protein
MPDQRFLELTNATEKTLKFIEIVAVFLKDEETPGESPFREGQGSAIRATDRTRL